MAVHKTMGDTMVSTSIFFLQSMIPHQQHSASIVFSIVLYTMSTKKAASATFFSPRMPLKELPI